MQTTEYLKIVVTVPESHAGSVREALGKAGGGQIGNYSYCSFSSKGVGRFLPNEQAKPFLGQKGALEEIIEERIEVTCAVSILEQVLSALRKAHPYEEPAIDLYPLYSRTKT